MPVRTARLSARLVVALSLLAGTANAEDASLPQTVRKAMASSSGPTLYAYDFTDRTTGETVTITRGRIDPSRPKGQRVTIIETTGDKDSAKRLDQRYERDADGDIRCLRAFGGAESLVNTRKGANGERFVTFRPQPRVSAGSEERQVYRKMSAEVVLDETTGELRTYSASLTGPVRPFIGVSLEAMDLSGTCTTGPDGSAILASARTRMKGSAFGRSLAFDVVQTISNLTPVSPPPSRN